jgi:hypothetical protein
MDATAFELTRTFLKKYSAHFAPAPSERLGYAIDDRFYSFADATLPEEGHLVRFRRMMDELTLDDVNGAIARHLRGRPLTIAIVAADAQELAGRLTGGEATPVEYESEMPSDILAEDVRIASFPLGLDPAAAQIVRLDDTFAA